jgi:serine/threonine protein kinase
MAVALSGTGINLDQALAEWASQIKPGNCKSVVVGDKTWTVINERGGISAWTVTRRLGSGAYKVVFEANAFMKGSTICETVAVSIMDVKQVSRELGIEPPELIARITGAFRMIMGACQGPGVPRSLRSIPLQVVNLADQQIVVIQPLYEGDLMEIMSKSHVPYSSLIDYLVQTSEALGFLHSKGIIHRDVRAANILIREGEAALSDWDTVTTPAHQRTNDINNVGFPYWDTPFRTLHIATPFTDYWGLVMTAGDLYFRDGFSAFSKRREGISESFFDHFLMSFMKAYLEKWKQDKRFPALTEEFTTPEELIQILRASTPLAQYCGAYMQMLWDIHRLIKRCAEFDKQLFELFKVARPSIDDDIERIYKEAVREWDPEQEVLRELQRIQEEYKRCRSSLQSQNQ